MRPIITTTRRSILAAILLSLALAACSTGGGSDDESTTTTADVTSSSEDGGTTDEPPNDTTEDTADEPATTEGGGAGDLEDLDLLLPTEADLPGWTETYRGPRPAKDDSEQSGADSAIADQCPDAGALLADLEDSQHDLPRAQAVFTKDGIEAEFTIGEAAEHFTPENVDALAGALDGCEVEYAEGGYEWLIVFFPASDDTYGDYGFRRWMASEILLPNGELTELHVRGHMFALNGLAAEVVITDGIEEDGSPIPSDPELIDEFLPRMEATVEAAG